MLIRNLKPHPLNARIYGTKLDDPALEASIRKLGVLEPIVVAKIGETHLIVSGARRWFNSKKAGLAQIPIREVFCSKLEAEQLLIESNRQRIKTKSQKIREYKELKRIETQLAKDRQIALGKTAGRGKKKPEGPSGPKDLGKASTRAAKAVGLGHRQAEQGLKVLAAAEAGKPVAAAAMAELDAGRSSIARAYRAATDAGEIRTKEEQLDSAISHINQSRAVKLMTDFENRLHALGERLEELQLSFSYINPEELQTFIQRCDDLFATIYARWAARKPHSHSN